MAKKFGYGEKAVKIMELLNTTNKTDHQIASAVGCHVAYVKQLRRKMAHKAKEDDLGETLYQITRGRQARKADAEPKITSNGAEDIRAMAQESMDALLQKREDQYGSFMFNANIAIRLKGVMHNAIAQQDLHLAPDQMLALDMIAVKISRILSGNPSHKDSWIDIAGYAKLVADRLQGNAR
jgi:hypothetical protein